MVWEELMEVVMAWQEDKEDMEGKEDLEAAREVWEEGGSPNK